MLYFFSNRRKHNDVYLIYLNYLLFIEITMQVFVSAVPTNMACNFEFSLCHWRPVSYNNGLWKTYCPHIDVSQRSLPNTDHTTNSSKYHSFYINTVFFYFLFCFFKLLAVTKSLTLLVKQVRITRSEI